MKQQANEPIKSMRNSEVIRASFWYILGRFIQNGIFFLSVPIFTRFLSPSDYGTVAIYSTWMTIFSLVITLNLFASVVRAKYDYDTKQYNEFLSSIICLGTLLIGITICIFVFIPQQPIKNIFGLEKKLIMYALFAGYFVLPINSMLSKWTVEYKYKKYFFTTVMSTILNISISIVLILLFKNERYLGRIYGALIVNGFLAMLFFGNALRKGRSIYKADYWRFALSYSSPLILHNLSHMILSRFDRIMIDKYIGRAEAGIYSFAYIVGSVVTIVWSAINTAWVPWFYKNMKEKHYNQIWARTKQYLVIFTIFTILTIITSSIIVKILVPKEYWVGSKIVPIILASGYFVFLYSFFVNVELYEKKTTYVSIGTISAALINIFANVLFIPKYGYIAAAWTSLFSYFFLFLFHSYIILSIMRKRIIKFTPLFFSGLAIIILSIVIYLLVHT